jgi:hypothetical protein
MPQPSAKGPAIQWSTDCFLLKPLGWVADRLAPAIDNDLGLMRQLITIDRAKMHLVALALAHMRDRITAETGVFLLERPQKEIVETLFGYQPLGMDRALRHLPDEVLVAPRYRQLVELLNDRAIAKFLYHTPSIDELKIVGLHKLPVVLRRPGVLKMFGRIDELPMFLEGLQLLANRSGLAFEAIATQIAALDQPAQIVAQIRSLIDRLPLPDGLPPSEIDGFRRIDCPHQIRALAKKWQNCLADCVYGVNEGTYTVYLSDQWNVVCLVCRYNRMGWFLAQCKGPKNTDVESDRLNQVWAAFARIGIVPAAQWEAVRNVLLNRNFAAAADHDQQDHEPVVF